ncbi:hypothetical protein [Agaribacterium sp. ZY112]|uniref:hypothetical protein n=1 Tax=Agaribacterium sp. ZY112 TaxID=3233574 RepID=UPI0035242C93
MRIKRLALLLITLFMALSLNAEDVSKRKTAEFKECFSVPNQRHTYMLYPDEACEYSRSGCVSNADNKLIEMVCDARKISTCFEKSLWYKDEEPAGLKMARKKGTLLGVGKSARGNANDGEPGVEVCYSWTVKVGA